MMWRDVPHRLVEVLRDFEVAVMNMETNRNVAEGKKLRDVEDVAPRIKQFQIKLTVKDPLDFVPLPSTATNLSVVRSRKEIVRILSVIQFDDFFRLFVVAVVEIRAGKPVEKQSRSRKPSEQSFESRDGSRWIVMAEIKDFFSVANHCLDRWIIMLGVRKRFCGDAITEEVNDLGAGQTRTMPRRMIDSLFFAMLSAELLVVT